MILEINIVRIYSNSQSWLNWVWVLFCHLISCIPNTFAKSYDLLNDIFELPTNRGHAFYRLIQTLPHSRECRKSPHCHCWLKFYAGTVCSHFDKKDVSTDIFFYCCWLQQTMFFGKIIYELCNISLIIKSVRICILGRQRTQPNCYKILFQT